ncbi:MAG: VCBS repeat-containing protein, partial [Candidatus Zixiibacteriota bacterium]
ISIAYGNGDGTFENPIAYFQDDLPELYQLQSIDVCFVNQDSLPDIVAISAGYLNIIINQGERDFELIQIDRPYHYGICDIAAGFINDDAAIDIIATPDQVFYGDGNGGFFLSSYFPVPFQAVQINDFNNDGIDDVITTTPHENFLDTIYVHVNDGYGSFQKTLAFYVGIAHWPSVADGSGIADFNEDGNADYAISVPRQPLSNENDIYILFGNGDGGIIDYDSIRVYGLAWDIIAADIDRDRHLDIVTENNQVGGFEFYLGDGTGNFDSTLTIDLGLNQSMAMAAQGDFDRDGNPDFVVGQTGEDPPPIKIAINNLPDAPTVIDEMITKGLGRITIMVQNPDTFAISRNFATVSGSDYWRFDFDQDGIVDETATDYNLLLGEYSLIISPKPSAPPGSVFSIGIRLNGSLQAIIAQNYNASISKDGSLQPESLLFYYPVEEVSSYVPPVGIPWEDNEPLFDWSAAVSGVSADSFHFQLDRFHDIRSPIYDISGLTLPQYQIPSPLGFDSVFYWRYRYCVSEVWSEFSNPYAAYIVRPYICGDASGDDEINLLDILFLIECKYGDPPGPEPEPAEAGDANADGSINLLDILYLIDYLYGDPPGPEPQCPQE